MRRKFFFLIDKLEIRRSERITISALLIGLVFTSSFFMLKEPKANVSPEQYAQLEKIFAEKSRSVQQERDLIMARYQPAVPESQPPPTLAIARPDTIKPDTTKNDEEGVSEFVNINTANSEKLQELPGIGPAYAQRILEWRDENGDFTSKEQLLEIRGIGERRLEAIKPLITL